MIINCSTFQIAVAPKIDRSTLNKIRVKAGHSFHFDVNVIGEPPPTITWSLKGTVLEPSAHIKINNEEYSSKITVKKCRRDDNGVYIVTATNEHGKDEAEVEAVVIGE